MTLTKRWPLGGQCSEHDTGLVDPLQHPFQQRQLPLQFHLQRGVRLLGDFIIKATLLAREEVRCCPSNGYGANHPSLLCRHGKSQHRQDCQDEASDKRKQGMERMGMEMAIARSPKVL